VRHLEIEIIASHTADTPCSTFESAPVTCHKENNNNESEWRENGAADKSSAVALGGCIDILENHAPIALNGVKN
jgi:hypothetical protein